MKKSRRRKKDKPVRRKINQCVDVKIKHLMADFCYLLIYFTFFLEGDHAPCVLTVVVGSGYRSRQNFSPLALVFRERGGRVEFGDWFDGHDRSKCKRFQRVNSCAAV